jgi:serine-type D-Ala-D-Ala carboxypeptidase (penicillin-binding protein 5/6)
MGLWDSRRPGLYARFVRPRRKRYRYRLRPLVPVAPLVVVAVVAGAWAGSRAPSTPLATAAAREPLVVVGSPVVHTVHAVPMAAAHLLTGGNLIPHTFSPPLTSPSAILVDASSGRVLWALRPHQRRQIASTTKIMTALLALRKLAPHHVVTIDKSVPRVPLVREGLRAGERVQAWKLFYAALLYSGNDDALALAIAAAGDKWRFLGQMNEEARRLGLRDTHFSSPSGVVDRDNYSSAWDLAALSRVALRNQRFARIVRTKVEHVSWAPPTYAKVYVNNNLMLRLYRGANGIKTGYTHKSGPCLVASATRHGVTLIAVVLDSPDMYADATRLLNLGFARS